MNTSRKAGLLVLNTKYPYKMAKSGQLQDSNIVICKELTYNYESIAFDIEQLFMNAILDMKHQVKEEQVKNVSENEIEINNYFEIDNPDDDAITENAKSLEMLIKMSSIPISKIIKLFDKLVDAGFIQSEGGFMMSTINMWQSIERNDRKDIMFKYISFFVKPLAGLSDGSTKTGKNTSDKVIQESGTLFV